MKEKPISFKVGNQNLYGILFEPEGRSPFPGVIFYHGRGSSRKRYLPIAAKLAHRGILALVFDFRGCGESEGVFEEQTHQNGIEDAAGALEFLLKENVDKERIGLCGSSFGAYAIGMILPKYPFIKSLLLRSPAAYSDRFLNSPDHKEKDFFAHKSNWEDSSVYAQMRNFNGAVLVLKCGSDELIPKVLVEKYYLEAKNARERKLDVLAGANHTLSHPFHLEDFYRKAYAWFLKTL